MKRSLTYPDCWTDDRRMKVLFSPLRPRSVNSENYDGQINFWKTQIQNFATTEQNPQISLSVVRNAFERNGEKPHCIRDVLAAMVAAGEIKPLDQFLQDSTSHWMSWVRRPLDIGMKWIREDLFRRQSADVEVVYIVLDVVNAQADAMLRSLKNSITSLSDIKKRLPDDWGISAEVLPLVLHELHCRQKIVTSSLDGAHSANEDEKTVFKFGTETHKAFAFTEIELAIQKLECTERDLMRTIGRMEEEMHEHEKSAKSLLSEKKRALAKNALRKRDATMKRMQKRVNCLENVQTLISKIHEVSDDANVLDAYRTGTKSLQMALSKSGITLDTVDEAIAEMQDVMELHDEIRAATATAAGTTSDDEELEKELEELVAGEQDLIKQLENLTVISEPPSSVAGGNNQITSREATDKREAVCLS